VVSKIVDLTGCQWLMPVILATWEAEIRGIENQGQPGQIAHKNPSPKQPEKNGLKG
jgi:hypothetical protein